MKGYFQSQEISSIFWIEYTEKWSSLRARKLTPGTFCYETQFGFVRSTNAPHVLHRTLTHIERANMTQRNFQQRFTRLTLGYSKKLENLQAACALHFCYYNFCRIPRTQRITPAMAAGVTDRIWYENKHYRCCPKQLAIASCFGQQ